MHYLLIDSSYLQYRSYFAYPNLTNTDGKHLGAIYGFIKSILTFQKTYKPDFIIFAKDLSGPTFRDEFYDAYKAGRLPTPPELKEQIGEIHEFLDLVGAATLGKAGYEADDMIATSTFSLICDPSKDQILSIKPEYNTDPDSTFIQSKTPDQIQNQVTIFSGDRDLYQLLAMPNVQMLISDRMGSTKLLGKSDFIEKYELDPAQWLDYKALVGDSSDNIKGVPGVGPKTATTLLQDHGSLADIYKHLGVDFVAHLNHGITYTNHQTSAQTQKPIAEKLAIKLVENLDNVILSYRLSKLAFPVMEIENKVWDLSKAVNKLQEWQFKSIIKELKLEDLPEVKPQQNTLF